MEENEVRCQLICYFEETQIPKTQKAWHVVRKGVPAHALHLDENTPVPSKLAKGEILIKVQAAALNPVGYKFMKLVPNFIAHRPYTAEHDFAGVVVDANGTDFKNGDEVYGIIPANMTFKTGQGCLSQYTRLPAANVVRRPDNITPTQAAGLSLSIFVNGGSTSVGAFAIQFAKAIGCKVAASASAKNEEFVRSLGADEFFDYTKGPLHEALIASAPSPKYHVFLEAVGLLDPVLYTQSEAYLAPNGIFISVGPQPKGFDVTGISKLLWNVFLQPRWLGGTKRTWKMVSIKPDQEDQKHIAQYVAEGKVKPVVDSVFSFEDTLKAYDRLMTGRATGKVVVKVDPTAE
ncbi:Zinc-type alcohol dehydrogenase-like protein C16A3.02c [Grifola frondosa]|uniref:Zinc-type alcohol dehydrogenase-like protein C16A3.02c n=1 Tax=Grifola frondosa TaxID=5627 RepID=A0A1C7LL19_GRIFR|nr:Zinc-type alcohol dehydrogenase-like protein C16A3.02c [Grifola frondosa]